MTAPPMPSDLYVREAHAGWARDVQAFAALSSLPASSGWTAEYDAQMDTWWVTTPDGQGVYYRRA